MHKTSIGFITSAIAIQTKNCFIAFAIAITKQNVGFTRFAIAINKQALVLHSLHRTKRKHIGVIAFAIAIQTKKYGFTTLAIAIHEKALVV